MKENKPNKDRGLRLALQHRNEGAEKMTLPEDFTDRLMQRIGQKEERPKRRRVWLYTAIGAIAASILLLLALHYNQDNVNPKKEPVIAQQTEQPIMQESPSHDGQKQGQGMEQQDGTVKARESVPSQMIAHQETVVDKPTTVNHRQNAALAEEKTSTIVSTTDSLDYYIEKIERELAQVDESLYIEKMNKVIRADERLQRIVNSYILHTLDKEGRPQTADNIHNVKSEQNEE